MAYFIGQDCEEQEEEQACSYYLVDYSNFEEGWGIWFDGDEGYDCILYSFNPLYSNGKQSVRLRDNEEGSHMTTQTLDLSEVEELSIDFTYITNSMDTSAEDFWLQISQDNGQTFHTIEEWNFRDEFENLVREYESIILPGPFSSTTKLRFRCDASSNGDQVYLDDIVIGACGFGNFNGFSSASPNQVPLEEDLEQSIELLEQELNISLFPNPVHDQLTIYLTGMNDAASIWISSVQGQVLYTQTIQETQTKLDVSTYPSGIYFLTLIENGERITKRFVVE